MFRAHEWLCSPPHTLLGESGVCYHDNWRRSLSLEARVTSTCRCTAQRVTEDKNAKYSTHNDYKKYSGALIYEFNLFYDQARNSVHLNQCSPLKSIHVPLFRLTSIFWRGVMFLTNKISTSLNKNKTMSINKSVLHELPYLGTREKSHQRLCASKLVSWNGFVSSRTQIWMCPILWLMK